MLMPKKYRRGRDKVVESARKLVSEFIGQRPGPVVLAPETRQAIEEILRQRDFYRQRCNNLHHAFTNGYVNERGNPEKVVCEIIANGYSTEAGQFGDGRHLPEGLR